MSESISNPLFADDPAVAVSDGNHVLFPANIENDGYAAHLRGLSIGWFREAMFVGSDQTAERIVESLGMVDIAEHIEETQPTDDIRQDSRHHNLAEAERRLNETIADNWNARKLLGTFLALLEVEPPESVHHYITPQSFNT